LRALIDAKGEGGEDTPPSDDTDTGTGSASETTSNTSV